MKTLTELHRRAKELFIEARELPEVERAAWLEEACDSDAAVRREVESLLAAAEEMPASYLAPYGIHPERPFELGELVDDRFRIVHEVARGGMGVVYEAVDTKLDRRVAIKCARTGYGTRLPPEVRHAQEITHPNVCKIFDIHTTFPGSGEIDFITMEFLEGETLTERLRRGPLPEKEARAIAAQLCAGLAQAHRSNVIHGDLKSSNVILTTGADGGVRAVITDFGLARGAQNAERAMQSGVVGGTPDYMAPELWKGNKASIASDIYALGVILHEIALGRRPPRPGLEFSGNPSVSPAGGTEAASTFTMPLDSAPHGSSVPQRAFVNRRWERALARCLEPEPSRRFATADQVAAALGPPRSRRWFLAAAAGIVLIAGSGVITYQASLPPRETVRLAVLPFGAEPKLTALAEDLTGDAAGRLDGVDGNRRTRFSFVPLAEVRSAGADTPEEARDVLDVTHVLHGTMGKEGDGIVLHAYLDDARSLVRVRDWEATYTPGEFRHASAALAGLVTGTLRLQPLVTAGTVNAAAHQDYLTGLRLLRRQSEVDAALQSLERAERADPDSPLTYAALAEAQRTKWAVTGDRKWWDLARESVRQAEKRNVDLAPVHLIGGLIRFDEGLYQAAAVEYRRAIELDPQNGDAYRRLGQAYERDNQLDEALAAFLNAIKADPEYFRNYQSLGSYYFRRGDYVQAVQYYQKEVDLAPGEAEAHFELAKAFLYLGEFAGAEQQLRAALALNPTSDELITMGLVLMYQGRDRDAIPQFQHALELSPASYLAWMNLGTAYRQANLLTESRHAYERGLELAEEELGRGNPESHLVRARLAFMSARLGNAGRAVSEIDQALRGAPLDGDVRFTAVGTFEALGQRDKALEVLRAAPDQVIADVSRWPNVADLGEDPRFLRLLTSRQIR